MLTTDQGTEYLSTKQREWYKEKSITLQTTGAYFPQQNDMAERFNRTLCEKKLAMILESGVPKRLWNEAAITAVYLINRSPSKEISMNKTTAEIRYRFRPDFTKIKVFGCEASYWVPDIHRMKLHSKSKKTVFLGYVPNGYKL